jgi:ketosteroid isomerase-like protein
MSETDADTDTAATVEPGATAPDDLVQRNIALLRRYLDAVNGWDADAMREILHPEVSFEMPFALSGSPRVTKGVDAVMAYLRSVPTIAVAMRLLDIRIHAFADDPDELVAEYRSEMTLTNGRPYQNTYISRATVRDGKLILFREHFDPAAYVEAVGGSITLPDP